jgi:histidinol-phosphate aminotransferase
MSSIAPYPAQDLSDEGVRVRMHRNEAAIPPPEHVIEAVRAIDAAALRVYPTDAQRSLVAELAASANRTSESVVVANGADELLCGIARAFLEPGDEALFADPSFGMYARAVTLARGVPRRVHYRRRWRLDVEELLNHATPRTKLILLGNPNNPTTDALLPSDVVALSQRLPQAVIAIDEVYLSLSSPSLSLLCASLPNAIVVRSFSKIAALAGMRVGYALAPEPLAVELRSSISPYPLSVASIAATRAYIGNPARTREFETRLAAQVSRSLDAIEAGLRPVAREVWRGAANFLLADMGANAGALVDALSNDGIAVRTFDHPLLEGIIRISAASDEDTDAFLGALRRAMQRNAYA